MRWTLDDVVRTPCREVWLQAGLHAALEGQELTRLSGPWGKRLRRLAAAKAFLLALAQYFRERDRPVRVAGGAAKAPEVGRLWLSGRTVWAAPTWVASRETIHTLRRGGFEEAWAVVPWPLREAEEPRRDDLLAFGLVLALEAPTAPEAARARAAGFPLWVLHWLPRRWHTFPAGANLTLKAERALTLHLHGRAAGAPAYQTVALAAEQSQRLALPWEQLVALSADAWPQGRVGLTVPGWPPHVVMPHQWENARLYGLEVWLLGFLTWGAFWRQARYFRRGERSFPHGAHFAPAYGVPWRALEPPRAV